MLNFMNEVELLDRNAIYIRTCDDTLHTGLPCAGHTVVLTVNTMPFGIVVGVSQADGLMDDSPLIQQRQFDSPSEAFKFFNDIHKRCKEIGYRRVWQGETMFDHKFLQMI